MPSCLAPPRRPWTASRLPSPLRATRVTSATSFLPSPKSISSSTSTCCQSGSVSTAVPAAVSHTCTCRSCAASPRLGKAAGRQRGGVAGGGDPRPPVAGAFQDQARPPSRRVPDVYRGPLPGAAVGGDHHPGPAGGVHLHRVVQRPDAGDRLAV